MTNAKGKEILIPAISALLMVGILSIAGEAAFEIHDPESIDSVVVLKGERILYLLSGGRRVREYRIALGRNPIGHKQQEGDGRTPEGRYLIDYRNPKSRYHLSLHISYPSRDDEREAMNKGVSPGGDIMIHGLPNGLGYIGKLHRMRDWTDGCIAVTNEEMAEIWRLVRIGTPIEIRP